MHRRNIFKMLAVIPFLGLNAVAETKKDWLVVSSTKHAWPCDWYTEKGELIKQGSYSKMFMRFETQAQAASFKAKLVPKLSNMIIATPIKGISEDIIDDKYIAIRAGYRGAIRALYKVPIGTPVSNYSFSPDHVYLVVVENGNAAYEMPGARFPDFITAWDFIDHLVIKEDDGESFSWNRLVQPFKRCDNVNWYIDAETLHHV